ncbi:formate dehydrogenase subunit gamma [Rhodoferax sp.]|uniref:formate dehydrogenase subunit gamma n=1 Tax=Rhodoferax sp. TaxID=50421 RepID=UPI00274535A7|nr:formate dehydrogenase subunit gamma [Rhodoferax sp.]
MNKPLAVLLASMLVGAGALAQGPAPAPAAAAPAIQSPSIHDVKPDASSEPGYAKQTNAERAQVQPGNNAPVWRQVSGGVTGYSSLPTPEAGNLVQPFVKVPGMRANNAGEVWRQVRNQWIIPYGGALLLIVLGAIGVFYWRVGTIALHGAPTGRQIERFTPFERAAHAANAMTFVILAVSGIVMAFGKFFILPVIGTALFGWLAYALKTAHNFAGPVFAVSLLVVIVTFIKDNLPRAQDFTWLLRGGGLLSEHEVASHRFNAGEKVLFWVGMLALGLIVVGSGLVMDKLVPGLLYERSTMQVAHVIHAVSTVLMLAMMLGHIYMGTIGTSGAYQGMKTGYVDETWAKEHHELWYDDVKSGKIPAQRSSDAPPGQTVQA